MSTSPEVIAARKLNQAKYALEDFDDSVGDLFKLAMVYCALALLLALSMIFGANNVDHLTFTLVGIIGLMLANRFDYLPKTNVMAFAIAIIGLLAMELLTLGLPDLLVPFLNANDYRGVPIFLNHLTPFIYWVVKLMAFYYLYRIVVLRQKVYAQPEELLRKVTGDRGL